MTSNPFHVAILFIRRFPKSFSKIKYAISKCVSKEQFGFLYKTQILAAIEVAQEGFHSIKSKRMKDLVLKLDLMKAYDRVYWTFICLLLLQIGLPLEITNWIMVCVSSANLIFLINGAHSSFFNF